MRNADDIWSGPRILPSTETARTPLQDSPKRSRDWVPALVLGIIFAAVLRYLTV